MIQTVQRSVARRLALRGCFATAKPASLCASMHGGLFGVPNVDARGARSGVLTQVGWRINVHNYARITDFYFNDLGGVLPQ